MNEVLKAIKERRSIRKFKSDEVKSADIDKIIEAGLYAASGMGKQAAIAIAVTDRALRDEISKDNCRIGGWDEGFDPFYGAPAMIIVLADKSVRTHVYDGSLALGNMMLAAHSIGIDSIWIHRAKEEFEMPKYKQLLRDLGIEGEFEGIGHLAIGYRDGDAPKAADRKEGRVLYVK